MQVIELLACVARSCLPVQHQHRAVLRVRTSRPPISGLRQLCALPPGGDSVPPGRQVAPPSTNCHGNSRATPLAVDALLHFELPDAASQTYPVNGTARALINPVYLSFIHTSLAMEEKKKKCNQLSIPFELFMH